VRLRAWPTPATCRLSSNSTSTLHLAAYRSTRSAGVAARLVVTRARSKPSGLGGSDQHHVYGAGAEHRRPQAGEAGDCGQAAVAVAGHLQQRERGGHHAGLVFTMPDGSPITPNRFSIWFRAHVKRLGLPRIRLHDVRHSYATAGLRAGVPVKVMSVRLGHATTAITENLYQHVLPAMDQDAATQVAGIIDG
jgi:Phage integrase family